jgi:hypothetical protein
MRRPRLPGDRFVAHTLAVTELYVVLVEHARTGEVSIGEFLVEAAAYWPDGLSGWIKPDAFVRVERGETADYWWFEADLATESLPTIRKKLLTYLGFVHRGQWGPDDVAPKVMIGTSTAKRREMVQSVIDELPALAQSLFRVAELDKVAHVMLDELAK